MAFFQIAVAVVFFLLPTYFLDGKVTAFQATVMAFLILITVTLRRIYKKLGA